MAAQKKSELLYSHFHPIWLRKEGRYIEENGGIFENRGRVNIKIDLSTDGNFTLCFICNLRMKTDDSRHICKLLLVRLIHLFTGWENTCAQDLFIFKWSDISRTRWTNKRKTNSKCWSPTTGSTSNVKDSTGSATSSQMDLSTLSKLLLIVFRSFRELNNSLFVGVGHVL